MSRFVYILSRYGEHGLEGKKIATLDRDRLPALLAEHFPDCIEEREKLASMLRDMPNPLPDDDFGDRISEGWGGVILTIATLADGD